MQTAYQRARYFMRKDLMIEFVLGKMDGSLAFRMRRRGLPIYGRCSSMGWERRTTVMGIDGSSTLSVGKAGSKIAIRGIAGLVGSARIGGNGTAGGAMTAQTASIILVRDVEVFHIHTIQGRGLKCEKSSSCYVYQGLWSQIFRNLRPSVQALGAPSTFWSSDASFSIRAGRRVSSV